MALLKWVPKRRNQSANSASAPVASGDPEGCCDLGDSTDSVLAVFRFLKFACLYEIVQDRPARIRRDAEESCCLMTSRSRTSGYGNCSMKQTFTPSRLRSRTDCLRSELAARPLDCTPSLVA
jgi:hypothetical protein